MAVTRTGHVGGTGTSTAALDVVGAYVTGWSDYKIKELSFVATSDCTLMVNGVDSVTLLANTPLNFGEEDCITSLAITEASVVYQVVARLYGTKA